MTDQAGAESDPDVDIVLRWLRAVESHDLDTARSLVTDDFVHTTGGDRRVMDWDTWVAGHRPIWEALPDSRYNESDVAVAGHVVTGWFHTRATHTGHLRLPALGIADLSPTGNHVTLPDEFFKAVVSNGKLASFDVDVPADGGLQAFLAQLGHGPVNLDD